MDINAIIAIILVCGIGFGCYLYGRSKGLPNLEETKDAILKDFLVVFTVIAKDCIDILTISNDGKKLSISEDEYKDLLARKIVDVFDRDVNYDKIIFSDAEKIAFVKQYVLNADGVLEKIKEVFAAKEEVINEAGATEVLSDAEVANLKKVDDSNKSSMVGSINSFYDKE